MNDTNAVLNQRLGVERSNGNGGKKSLKAMLSDENIKGRFRELLGKKSAGFMSSIINVVNGNNQLQSSDPQQIIAAAAIAASMDLPIDPNLGFAYIVPYKGKPQFQMGWRGFVQLAMRTAQYKTINASEVYEGEIIKHNRFTGEIEVNPDGKESDEIVGYIAYFKLINGFEKYDYMTLAEVTAHAKRFSQSYGKSHSPWQTDFNAMATKTVLKRLLSKYGILSIEMQAAVNADQATVTEHEDGSVDYDYPDNGKTVDAEAWVSGSDDVPESADGKQAAALEFGEGSR